MQEDVVESPAEERSDNGREETKPESIKLEQAAVSILGRLLYLFTFPARPPQNFSVLAVH
jgi:hypothetical protein